jgi:serine/threonine protein kinase
MKRIVFYINKITNYLDKNKDLNVNSIIEMVESILYNKDIIKKYNIEPLILLINKCKNYGNIINNDLERILKKIDPNINNYIYFLNNKDNLFNEKEKIIDFLINVNYQKKSFKEIDNLNLKRGFIQGIQRDDKNYLLKYQPNKSLMELVLNCYIKVLNETNFLIPLNFFINEDNSYFYIIEKYDTDLYKYFHLLETNNKIIKFNEIINITKFIMNSVDKLHKNNIIHSDLKPENIVLNLNKDLEIDTLKIIDFDVGLFNSIPSILSSVPKKYEKVLNNKKPRGTRIYMLKNEKMEFKNDIFAIGVILIVILYKNIKNLLSYKKKENNKKSLKIQNFIKKMNILKDTIDKKESKIKLLDLMEIILKKESSLSFFDENNFDNFLLYKKIILDCINTENLSIILGKINKL